jgi:hypothetical protein
MLNKYYFLFNNLLNWVMVKKPEQHEHRLWGPYRCRTGNQRRNPVPTQRTYRPP